MIHVLPSMESESKVPASRTYPRWISVTVFLSAIMTVVLASKGLIRAAGCGCSDSISSEVGLWL